MSGPFEKPEVSKTPERFTGAAAESLLLGIFLADTAKTWQTKDLLMGVKSLFPKHDREVLLSEMLRALSQLSREGSVAGSVRSGESISMDDFFHA